MHSEEKPAFLAHFDRLKDPRIDRKKLYPLVEVLFVIICGGICGAQSWRDFVLFGKEKLDYLRRFLPFANGIPSKNTFARVMSQVSPELFRECFLAWIKSFQLALREVIAIDGKTLRHSFDNANQQSAIHMVSAFATEARLVLGQEKVYEKSNEITAIPRLLELLEVSGTIISIDAMGTQKNIAAKIREKKADYIFALKGNQGTLHADIKLFLDNELEKENSHKITSYFEDHDKGHGRIEHRKCYASDKINWLSQKEHWCDLKSIAVIESTVTKKEKTVVERRYYLSSLPANAEQIGKSVRSHWAIENSLHWVLDVTMGEDASRTRKDHAPQNMAMIRHVVLNMLRNNKKTYKDISIKGLQKKAGWGESTLDSILMQTF